MDRSRILIMKKKITIITLQNIRNYGSALQALATQEVFHSVGCDVEFFNYFRTDIISVLNRIRKRVSGFSLLKKTIYLMILWLSMIREEKIFKRFLRKYVNTQKEVVSTLEDFQNLKLDSDIYCTGSDQTWNSTWNDGVLPELFLSFVPNTIRKIAYAASFGKSKLDESEIEETRKLISRYDAISVRESSAVDIVEKLGKSATLVLDPTLQVSKDYWLDKFHIQVDKDCNPYVLVYQLNSNKLFDKYAKNFAKKKGLRLVRFCIRHYQMIRGGHPVILPPVEDFVRLIANAKYVITDSFHATAFSINLNTDMICVYPYEFAGRIASILNLTGLTDRHLKDYKDFSFVDTKPIDFAPVNEILGRERIKGEHFLKDAIYGNK